jgi:2-polyprenyl-3-methyl-5-hydroxy-6-metoxy-1,4-benzoquinol methylase
MNMDSYNKKLLTYNCPFCLNNAVITKFNNVLKCNKCKIMFQKSDSIINNIADIYGIDYFQGKVYNNYFNEELERKRRFEKKIELIRTYIPKNGRVLDVGCAAGFFLKVMEKSGYETYGLDVSSAACEYAMNYCNSNIFNGNIFKAGFMDNFFNMITLWDVLEHLRDPELVLGEFYRIMKNQGILVIETLNINSWNAKLLKSRWPLYSPDYHLFYYNTKFLIKLLNKIGFNVIKIFPVQTYICLGKKIWTIRYFDRPLIGKLLGHFLDDVILIIAVK